MYKGIRFRYILAASVVASAIGGGAVGYTVASKKLEAKYVELSKKEIADAKDYYSKFYKSEEYSDPVELAKNLGVDVEDAKGDPGTPSVQESLEEYKNKLIENLQYRLEDLNAEGLATTEVIIEDEVVEETVEEVVTKNIFYNENDILDPEDEMKERDRTKPYIISHDEFFEGEEDYAQSQYTYFEKDDVLADEQDKVVEDSDFMIGDDNLKFGYMSKDPNVVYIRNERLELDFEIMRSQGSYAQEVIGFIEHSDKPGLRKFRDY